MTDREAFEKCLIDHPDDETARLVYADWLEEQYDPKLVELGGKLRGPDAKQAVSEFLTYRRIRMLRGLFGWEVSLESVFQTIEYRRKWAKAAKDQWLSMDAAVLTVTRERLRNWADADAHSRVMEEVHRKAMEVSPNPLRRFTALLKTKLTRKDRRT